MDFLISIIVSFFLSIKGVTNKKLLVFKSFSGDEIVVFRYLAALSLTLILVYFFPNFNNLSLEVFILMLLISLFDFIGTFLTQKYLKQHPNSSFQNFLGSFIPIVYIPIGIFLLGENFSFYDFIGVFIIIISLFFLSKFKELNFKSLTLLGIVVGRLIGIFLIGYYIDIGGYFLNLLVFIYLFVIFSYLIKYIIKPYKVKKLKLVNYTDAIFFSIGSIGAFFLYEIFESYEVRLFLLSTFFFNVILFSIFFKENHVIKKLTISFFIIVGLVFLKI